MSKRFELINFLNAHDDFKDNKNNKKLDSFDVVRLLNHYDELQNILVEKDQIAELVEENEQLKQQLAEKEKEILNISEYFGKVTFELRELCNKKDQDKISFAVEWLEKVRKTIKNLHGQKNCKIGNSYIQKKDKLYNKYIIELDILEEVLGIFDNQIKQLKENKDV